MRHTVKKYVIMCGDQFVADDGRIVDSFHECFFYDTPNSVIMARRFDPENHRIKELVITVDSDSPNIAAEVDAIEALLFANRFLERDGDSINEIAQIYGPVQHAFFKAKEFSESLVNPHIVFGHLKEKDKKKIEEVLGLTLQSRSPSKQFKELENRKTSWSDLPMYRYLMAETDAVALHMMFPKTAVLRYDPDGTRKKVIEELKTFARRALVAAEAANIKITGDLAKFEETSVDYLLRKIDLVPELWNPR